MKCWKCATLAAAAAIVVWASPAVSQTGDDQKPPVDPSGTWKWEVEFNENTAEFSLKLQWDGKQLEGRYTSFGETVDILDGAFADGEVSFRVRREFNGTPLEVKFRGKVAPDAIAGKVVVDFGGDPREFDWNPRRVVEIDDVVGTWQLRLETPDGQVIEPKLTISREKESLKGHYVSPILGEHEPRRLELKDNKLTWEISASFNGQEFQANYQAMPRGNVLEGKIELGAGEQARSATFTGKRLPAKKDDKPQAKEE